VERSYLQVKVFPSQRRPGVWELAPNRLEVRVTAAAERGLANRECLVQLASYLGCQIDQLHIVKGATGPHKIIERIG
jgi:uncharacterized protein YggU (UPF0235/DUF167 family)